MNILIIFTLLSIVNVVFSIARELITIHGGKTLAAFVNGGYWAYYTIVLIYTVAEFPLWQKCLIVFLCNIAGTYLVKWIAQKARKDKIWKFEIALPTHYVSLFKHDLDKHMIPYNYFETKNGWIIFNVYCETQKESEIVIELASYYGDAKYFASETKI